MNETEIIQELKSTIYRLENEINGMKSMLSRYFELNAKFIVPITITESEIQELKKLTIEIRKWVGEWTTRDI